MVKVAIAGGKGHLGATIAEVLKEDSRHEYIVLSREAPKNDHEVQVNYDDGAALKALLEEHQINTIISTIQVLGEPAANSEKNLVKAAAASSVTKRFIASVWGAPVPAEAYSYMPHLPLRRSVLDELRKTDLEWTQCYNGYFMDYYGMPHVKTNLGPPPFAIDVANKIAGIPGTGDEEMVFTYTYDVAKFVAEIITMSKWDEETVIVGDRITLNEFVSLAEKARGSKFEVSHDDADKLNTFQITELPAHTALYPYFPKQQLQFMFAAFGKWVVAGAFNLPADKAVNKQFSSVKPMSVKQMLTDCWEGKEE